MKTRTLLIIAAGLAFLAILLLIAAQPVPERPVKDGAGPLAVKLDPGLTAPSTHSPLDWWQAHHPDVVNGGDLARQDCLYCHNPETSCNNCHRYVGVADIVRAR